MEHISKWDKLDEQCKATGDIEPIRREWRTLCKKHGDAGDDYWKVYNTGFEKERLAMITLKNARLQLDEFRKKFFTE